MEPPAPALTDKYRLLEYAVEHWDYHTKWLGSSIGNGSIWNLFIDLVISKSLPFNFRKWGSNEHYGIWGCSSCREKPQTAAKDLPFMSLVHYAASIGHLPMLLLLRPGMGISQNLSAYCGHEPNLRTLFIGTSSTGNDCLKHVLRYTLDSFSHLEVLEHALTSGHVDVVRIIFKDYDRPIVTLDKYSALRSAIRNGQATVVGTLLDAGVPFDLEHDPKNRESFGVAFQKYHDAVITTVLRKGGLLPSDDAEWDHEIALHLAAGKGNIPLVQFLLEAGAQIN